MMQLQIDNRNELERKAAAQLAEFLRDCEISRWQGKRLLEIGFKNGLFLEECRKAGLEAVGLEINQTYVEKVKTNLPSLDLRLYDGGRFPFDDASFDFIVSFQVLEHVGSVSQIIAESVRLLRPGGMMYHVCPNYRSFYEGHFNVVWLPFLNKPLGRWYLKLLGRYKPTYENLNLVGLRQLRRAVDEYAGGLELVSLGKCEFVKKFSPEQIAKVNNGFLRRMLELLIKSGPVKDCVLACVCGSGTYYPLTLICRKV